MTRNWRPKYIELKQRAIKMASLYKEGKSIPYIASVFGMSIASVYNYLNYSGIRFKRVKQDPITGKFMKDPRNKSILGEFK